jgi:hypothetical protein
MRQEVTQGGTMAEQSRWAMAVTAQWMAEWQRDRNEQWWRRWVTAGVMIGDGNCGGTIAMGHSGGGAMAGRTAVQS